jgi:AraC-like DNA-binding protein
LLTGEDWAPARVCFAHEAPGDTGEHDRVFRGPVSFSTGRLEMHVPNRVLDLPNPRANEGLLNVLDRYAEGLLEKLPRAVTFSERVRARLLEELKGGAPTAESLARSMRMSVRSLHRGLRSEGRTFREILEQLRHETAVALLTDDRASIAEVGFLLGFSELSSFYRAFRRWTGKTPAEFRAEARALASKSLPLGR